MTMELISTVTVGAGGSSTISFSAIPQTATDLYLTVSVRTSSSGGADDTRLGFNGSTGSFISKVLAGLGNGTNSFNFSQGNIGTVNNSYVGWSNAGVYIANYSISGVNKNYLSDWTLENNQVSAYDYTVAGRWTGTAAITSLTLTNLFSGVFDQNSTVSLYTITKGVGGATTSSA
jgi:hypothetical protein